MAPPEAVPTVLFVCTANICRSPIAEAIFDGRCRALGISLQVRSAGVFAVRGPIDELAQKVLLDRGLDGSQHEATRATPTIIAGATLILAMERAHVAEITTTVAGAFTKTFGLTEIVALGGRHGPRRTGESIDEWTGRLQADRHPADVMGSGTNFDIADPHGGSFAGYSRCATQLTQLIDALVLLLDLPGA